MKNSLKILFGDSGVLVSTLLKYEEIRVSHQIPEIKL